MAKVELAEDLGIINGKRKGMYKCSCGTVYEARTDIIRYNDKHGKQNGCSRKCKKNKAIPPQRASKPTILREDVLNGYWDDTMFGDDFDRFFAQSDTGLEIIAPSVSQIATVMKAEYLWKMEDIDGAILIKTYYKSIRIEDVSF